MRLALGLWAAAVAWAQLPPSAVPRTAGEGGGFTEVVVTDAQGREAGGLNASDFLITQSGNALKIVDAVYSAPDAPRTFVLIVDDYNLPLESLGKVRAAVRSFIEEKMRPEDRASILRTRSGTGVSQQLTSDREVLRAAVEGIHGGVPARRSPDRRFSVTTVGILRQALTGARWIEGRKVLVLFCQRFRTELKDWAWLDQLAQRARAAVYVVDMGVADGEAGPALLSAAETLARESGGKVFDGVQDPGGAMDRVLAGLSGSYRLRFEGAQATYDIASGGGRFEDLSVRTSVPGLNVKLLEPGIGGEEEPATPEEEISRDLVSPFVTSVFPVRAGFGVDGSTAAGRLQTIIGVEATDLTWTLRADGKQQAAIEVMAAVFDARGRAGDAGGQLLRLTAGEPEKASMRAGAVSAAMALPAEGLYVLNLLVRDETSGRSGKVREVIDVTAPEAGAPWVGGMSLRRPPGEEAKWSGDMPGVGVFAAGGSILYACPVRNVGATAERKSRLETVVSVFREGRLIFNAEPAVKEFDAAPNPSERMVGGIIELGAQQPPGEYTIELKVTDLLRPAGKPAVVMRNLELR